MERIPRWLPNLSLAGSEFLFNIHNDLIETTLFFHGEENCVISTGSVGNEFICAIRTTMQLQNTLHIFHLYIPLFHYYCHCQLIVCVIIE